MKTIGIDISANSLRAVEISNGKISWTGEGGDEIIMTVRRRRADRIVVSVRGSQILTRTEHIPASELEGIEKLIPGVEKKDILVAYQPVSGRETLIGIVRRAQIEEIISRFETYNLIPDAAEPPALPLWKIYREKIGAEGLIIHLENNEVTAVVIRNGLPYASHLQLVKQKKGEEFLSFIARILQYYRDSGLNIDKMLITRPHATLRRKIKAIFPTLKTIFSANSGLEPEFIYAYGVALSVDNFSFNLIPDWLKQQKKKALIYRKVLRAGKVINVAALLAILGIAGFDYLTIRSSNNIAQRIKPQIAELSAAQSILNEVRPVTTRSYSAIISKIVRSTPKMVALTRIRTVTRRKDHSEISLIQINGYAKSPTTVIRMLSRLQDENLDIVEFKNSSAKDSCCFEILLYPGE